MSHESFMGYLQDKKINNKKVFIVFTGTFWVKQYT